MLSNHLLRRFSPAVKSAYNYIFVFDRAQYLTLSSFGLLHVHHLALAVNASRLCRLLGEQYKVQ